MPSYMKGSLQSSALRRLSVLVAFLSLAAIVVACGKEKEPDAKPSAKAADTPLASAMADMPDMPGMPGMKDTTKTSSGTTLSASQVAHGRIAWAAPSVAAMAGVVEVPGQLVPNEDRTARLAA